MFLKGVYDPPFHSGTKNKILTEFSKGQMILSSMWDQKQDPTDSQLIHRMSAVAITSTLCKIKKFFAFHFYILY